MAATATQIERHGIGGSDAAAIVGLNPYEAPIDVWLRLTGRVGETPDNEPMYWGRELEPVIRKRYSNDHNVSIFVPIAPLYHPVKSWARGTPDGIVIDTAGEWQWGVECKTAGAHMARDWGADNSDEIPPAYACQATWYMWLTGLDRWDFPVLFGGQGYRVFRVNRDDDAIAFLTDACERFWHDHVVADVEPPVDGSEGYRKHLLSKFGTGNGKVIEATPDDDEIIARYLAACADEKNAKDRKDLAGNQLLARGGEHDAIYSATHGRIPLVRAAGSPRYKLLAELLATKAGMSPAEYATMIEEARGAPKLFVTPPRGRKA